MDRSVEAAQLPCSCRIISVISIFFKQIRLVPTEDEGSGLRAIAFVIHHPVSCKVKTINLCDVIDADARVCSVACIAEI